MYNSNNIRSLKKTVEKMKKGEKLYINAISLSVNVIEQLRDYIEDNVLLPDKMEVERVYNDISSVMSGKVIFPQMTYIRQ